MTECDEIIIVMDIVSTKETNAKSTNVTKTCNIKKARDYYIFHTVLLAIVLLLVIAIICYHYAKQKSII